MQPTQTQIVLSIYNGEHHLKDQLDSLFQQTNQQWTLLVRDDGSTDGSVQIIQQYAEQYPNRVKWLKDDEGNVGALHATVKLIKATTADYVFVCDQDDYWLKDKIQCSLDALKKAEQLASKSTPLLLHTNMYVVDQHLNQPKKSYFEKSGSQHEKLKNLSSVLLANYFAAFTILINRALIHEIQWPPKNSSFLTRHTQDWWLSLFAVSTGKVITVDTPTVLHRRHDSGDTRQKAKIFFQDAGFWWRCLFILLPLRICNRLLSIHTGILTSQKMTQYFYATLKPNHPAYDICKTYVEICNQGFLGRKLGFIRQGYRLSNLANTLVCLVLF